MAMSPSVRFADPYDAVIQIRIAPCGTSTLPRIETELRHHSPVQIMFA
jgi:hypothetical protein